MRLLPGDTARPFPQVCVMQPPNPSHPTPPIFISIELAAPAQILQRTAAPLFYSFLDLICSLALPRDREQNALQPCAAASNTGVREGRPGCTIVPSQM